MFSIIIPVKKINDYIREGLTWCEKLEGDFEIFIFPDSVSDEELEEINAFPVASKVRVIASGEVGPAIKRDMCMEYAQGDYYAFIDDDAYPEHDWLTNALEYFKDETVGAVGGPAVTAHNDDMWQRAGGKVYESVLCSAGYVYRYLPREGRDVDDLPSVNLIVKKDIFDSIGGYDSDFYPGEDTKLCLDIIEKAGKRIVYSPEVLVYHHRRRLFKAHLKQATNYAKHRGYFAKVLPETSRKIAYFIPSLFVLGLICGPIISIFLPVLWWMYFGVLIFYFMMVGFSVRSASSFLEWVLAMLGIFATHVGYGINFIKGLLSKELLR